jgi:mitochondrial chaperone BCS1
MADTTVGAGTTPQTPGPNSPTDLISSIASINSWLHLAVIGGTLEGLRRLFSAVWERILTAFFLSATFEEDESCHGEVDPISTLFIFITLDRSDWLETWLLKQTSWSESSGS